MKTWYGITCVCCGFRHYPRRFVKNLLNPIKYPLQLIGGGYAKGFHIVRQVSWSEIPQVRQDSEAWQGIIAEHARLVYRYDQFYNILGFLSPQIRQLVDSLNEEIFQLRQQNRDLREANDRSILTHWRRDSLGEFGKLIEEINSRDTQECHSARDLFK